MRHHRVVSVYVVSVKVISTMMRSRRVTWDAPLANRQLTTMRWNQCPRQPKQHTNLLFSQHATTRPSNTIRTEETSSVLNARGSPRALPGRAKLTRKGQRTESDNGGIVSRRRMYIVWSDVAGTPPLPLLRRWFCQRSAVADSRRPRASWTESDTISREARDTASLWDTRFVRVGQKAGVPQACVERWTRCKDCVKRVGQSTEQEIGGGRSVKKKFGAVAVRVAKADEQGNQPIWAGDPPFCLHLPQLPCANARGLGCLVTTRHDSGQSDSR